MVKKTKSTNSQESLEDQSADKLIMLVCHSGWSNFKQIVLVREQQDVCCSLDQPRYFPVLLSGKLANKPQQEIVFQELARGEDVCPSLPCSYQNHRSLKMAGRSFTHKTAHCSSYCSFEAQILCLFDTLVCS